MLLNARKQEL